MQPIEIPRGVDDPPMLLLWRLDDLLPITILMVLGILIEQLLFCLLAGVVISRLYARFRDSRPDGYALHWCYWHGLLALKARTCPNPFSRIWRS